MHATYVRPILNSVAATVSLLMYYPPALYGTQDVEPIRKRCAELGTIKHVRFPIKDFNPQASF